LYSVTRYKNKISTRRLLFLSSARAVTAIFPSLRGAGCEIELAENLNKGLDVMVGNRTHAAELLGIFVRTLRNKRNEYHAQGLPADA
jgi:DNA-binding protein Fis